MEEELGTRQTARTSSLTIKATVRGPLRNSLAAFELFGNTTTNTTTQPCSLRAVVCGTRTQPQTSNSTTSRMVHASGAGMIIHSSTCSFEHIQAWCSRVKVPGIRTVTPRSRSPKEEVQPPPLLYLYHLLLFIIYYNEKTMDRPCCFCGFAKGCSSSMRAACGTKPRQPRSR